MSWLAKAERLGPVRHERQRRRVVRQAYNGPNGREVSAEGEPVQGRYTWCSRGGAIDNYAARQRSASRRFILAEDVLHRLPVGIRLVRTVR